MDRYPGRVGLFGGLVVALLTASCASTVGTGAQPSTTAGVTTDARPAIALTSTAQTSTAPDAFNEYERQAVELLAAIGVTDPGVLESGSSRPRRQVACDGVGYDVASLTADTQPGSSDAAHAERIANLIGDRVGCSAP